MSKIKSLILDWDKVREIIEKEKPDRVDAGLFQDWYWTAAEIYKDGEYIKNHGAYTHSYWATPGIEIHKGDWSKRIECSREMTDEDHVEARRKHDEMVAAGKRAMEDIRNGN